MSETPNTPRIGIPYAPSIAPDYKKVECPVCHLHIEEAPDRYGEQTSQNYAKHYADAHQDRQS